MMKANLRESEVPMSENMLEQAVHYIIAKDGKPQSFIHLTLRYEQEGEWWCGHCAELGTVAQAETYDQVQQELRESVLGQLEVVAESPTTALEDYLGRQGVPRYRIEDMKGPERIKEAEMVPA